MKIGILTFYESDNYGTILQAYALQYYLEIQGHHIEIVHVLRDITKEVYSYDEIKPTYSLYSKVRSKVVRIRHRNAYKIKHNHFEYFRKTELNVSKYLYKTREMLFENYPEYDLYISGGDQIWNPYHKVFSYTYMWDFLPIDKKRISYGSSFGIEKIEDKNIYANMCCYLKRFHALSVRETYGVEIIESMGLQVQHVLDPVFLIRDIWNDLMEKEYFPKEKYCIIYAMSDYSYEDDEIIKKFAKRNKLKIFILPDNRRNHENFYRKAFDLSPKQFLSYIAHADAVFTNSFHGLAFSIIFRRQFALLSCVTKGGMSRRNRLTDLLKTLEICDERSPKDIEVQIKYDLIDKKIEDMILSSKDYLNTAIINNIR